MTDDNRKPRYSCEEENAPHTLGMFRPIHAPISMMFPIDPITREDGRVLKRFRFMDPINGPICVEDPMDTLIQNTITEIKPMEMPSGLLFYLDPYGKESQDKAAEDLEKALNAVPNKEQE